MADSTGYDTTLHDSLPDSPVPSSHRYESDHSDQETHPEYAALYVTSRTGTELAELGPSTSAPEPHHWNSMGGPNDPRQTRSGYDRSGKTIGESWPLT